MPSRSTTEPHRENTEPKTLASPKQANKKRKSMDSTSTHCHNCHGSQEHQKTKQRGREEQEERTCGGATKPQKRFTGDEHTCELESSNTSITSSPCFLLQKPMPSPSPNPSEQA
ncbi:hypothetical protein M758_3G091200 [Ceratodon purpureus]|nr:hypothetical protein M758_3G091200 [Ceratodon purpureus]